MRCARQGLVVLGIATTQRAVRSGVSLGAIGSAVRSMPGGSRSDHVVKPPLLFRQLVVQLDSRLFRINPLLPRLIAAVSAEHGWIDGIRVTVYGFAVV